MLSTTSRLALITCLILTSQYAFAENANIDLQQAEKAVTECQQQGVAAAKELFANDLGLKNIIDRYNESGDERLRYISFGALEIYVRQELLNIPKETLDASKTEKLMKAFKCNEVAEAHYRDLTDDNG